MISPVIEVMFKLKKNTSYYLDKGLNVHKLHERLLLGSKGGAVVRATASQQYDLGSSPGIDAIYGLSLLLVLSFAPRGFSPSTPVFFLSSKPNTFKFHFDLERTSLRRST